MLVVHRREVRHLAVLEHLQVELYDLFEILEGWTIAQAHPFV